MISNTAGDRLYKQIHERLMDAYNEIHLSGNWIDDKFTESVENKLKKITGRKYAKLVTSGTSALNVALLSWNIINKNVACTNYSYVASVSQASLINKVDFFDVDKNGVIDLENKFTQDAVIPVSLYGNTIDYDKFKVSDHTKIIVDCAQSLGAKYKNKADGSFGDVAVFSFARNKPVPTAGTHGALVWDDDSMMQRVKAVSNNGKLGMNSPIEAFGINAIPMEIQAAWIDIGLDHMGEWQVKRKQIHDFYCDSFATLPVNIIQPNEHCESNYHKFAMTTGKRKSLYEHLKDNKIHAPLHYVDNFAHAYGHKGSFTNTDYLCNTIITLPNHAWLTDTEVETVAHTVKKFFNG